jgi:hypothetical protein
MSTDLTISSSVETVASRLTNMIESLTALRVNISDSYSKYKTGLSGNKYIKSGEYEIQNLKQQESTFDTEFEEAEAIYQQTGGKSRKQTLQEFVLLFFFVAFGVFTASVCIYTFVLKRNVAEALKMGAVLLLLLVVIVALIIRLG